MVPTEAMIQTSQRMWEAQGPSSRRFSLRESQGHSLRGGPLGPRKTEPRAALCPTALQMGRGLWWKDRWRDGETDCNNK